jgi:hypothetical protein
VPHGSPRLGHLTPPHSPNTMISVKIRLEPTSSQSLSDTCHRTKVPHHLYGRATCYPYNDDMCHPQIGPPIHPHQRPYAQSTCHVSSLEDSNCSCHASYMDVRPVQSATTWHCLDCTDCIVIIFLPVWQNEQITISGAYDVHLSLFKLRWVCINEVYTHICFEAIMRNFIFRPFRAPSSSWIQFWITPPD